MTEVKPQRYAIVGMKHRGAEALVASLPPDEPITLVREPGNKYDPNAVQVWARGKHVGYVPKAQNAVLARFIDATGRHWMAPSPVAAMDASKPAGSVEVFRAVDARLHLGSNTYPLIEVV